MREHAMKKNISRTLLERLPILLRKHNASDISRMYGVSREMVRQLIVKIGGYRPEYRKWKNDRTVSWEIRDRVRQDYLDSHRKRGTPAKLSRKYGLPYSTVVSILGLKKARRKNTAEADGYRPGPRKWGRVSSTPAEIREKVESEYITSDQRYRTIANLSQKYGLKYSITKGIIKRMKLKNKAKEGNGDM